MTPTKANSHDQEPIGALRASPSASTPRPLTPLGAVTDPRLPHALTYATNGWPVFVLGRSKRPVANCRACPRHDPAHDPAACGCLTCHGFYAATLDPDRITAMLTAVPDGLLAIRTGAVSGLVGLDIDPRNGGRVEPDLMPPTKTVATGGGGWHLLYHHPGTPVLSRRMRDRAGVDVKADGGYLVAPPSIHPDTGRPYRHVGDRPVNEMPPALLSVCLAPAQPSAPSAAQRPSGARTAPLPTHSGRGGITSPAALLAAHLDAVARAPQGRRRTTLYGAARGIARMVAADAITRDHAWHALYATGRAAGQTDRDIHAAILGAFTDELTPAQTTTRKVS